MPRKFQVAAFLLICFVANVCTADELKQVIIVTRHGVRAPTWTPDRLNQYSVSPWPDFGVPPGNLTPHGRKLMTIMGEFYRDLYSKSGLLGAPACGDAKRTYFYADTDQRTIETARALVESMLPGCKADVNSKLSGAGDALFNAIESGHANPDLELSEAAVRGRIGPRLDSLLDVYGPEFRLLDGVLNGKGKARKSIFDDPIALKTDEDSLSMTGPLAISSTFTEVLLLEYANGFSGEQFAWGRLTPAELQQVLVLHTAYAELMRRTPSLAKVRGSNLLSRIVRTMEQATTRRAVRGALGRVPASLVMLVGHDTNISNLSGLLRLSWMVDSHQVDDAPPGGALVFSLWKSSSGRYSVTVQFVAQTLDQMHNATRLTLQQPPVIADLFVPECSSARAGYPCDWTVFKQLANRTIDPAFVEQSR